MDSEASIDSEATMGSNYTERTLPDEWEVRYDPVLSEYYYVNMKENIIQFDSPLEVMKRQE
ncbi:DEKNAAC104199 [Brettanomyces naardenensis]|uniref:DEKNAAC104199 n=1 Tax=Brettanomyces naardenensis TaxID=13370 RepID=A0A448YQA6_BRENA|nr:DEKNAAC104199 [Brettanomyces naardenensis]